MDIAPINLVRAKQVLRPNRERCGVLLMVSCRYYNIMGKSLKKITSVLKKVFNQRESATPDGS